MTNEQAKDPIHILRDALTGMLCLQPLANDGITGIDQPITENDVVACRKAREALALTESATAAPIAAGVVPEGCIECMQEAANVLSGTSPARTPLADELHGFSLMLKDAAPAHPVAGAVEPFVPAGYANEADFLRSQLSEARACIKAHQAVLAERDAEIVRLIAPASPAVTTIIPEAGAETGASRDVLAERQRQKDVEDWTPEHDDEHPCGEIAAFAAVYAMPPAARDWPASETSYGDTFATALCPEDWHPKFGDRRRELVKAGALILAEIERLDRAALKGGSPK